MNIYCRSLVVAGLFTLAATTALLSIFGRTSDGRIEDEWLQDFPLFVVPRMAMAQVNMFVRQEFLLENGAMEELYEIAALRARRIN